MEPAYSFNFVNRDGSVDVFELGAARDDGDAALRARSAMLVSLTAVAVEVWKDGAQLCRIRRDGGPAPFVSRRQALASSRTDPAATYVRREGDGCRPAAAAVSA